MHLLYLDDAGSTGNAKEQYFVLGGISIYEAQSHWITQELDKLAEKALAGVKSLRQTSGANKELAATLTDMESMAYLGRYYADKIRGAADLAIFRADSNRKEHHRRAIQHLTSAVTEWQAYAQVATSQYRPQLYSRTHYMDWLMRLEDVKKEVETVRAAGP